MRRVVFVWLCTYLRGIVVLLDLVSLLSVLLCPLLPLVDILSPPHLLFPSLVSFLHHLHFRPVALVLFCVVLSDSRWRDDRRESCGCAAARIRGSGWSWRSGWGWRWNWSWSWRWSRGWCSCMCFDRFGSGLNENGGISSANRSSRRLGVLLHRLRNRDTCSPVSFLDLAHDLLDVLQAVVSGVG
jgi:hypothetical protein